MKVRQSINHVAVMLYTLINVQYYCKQQLQNIHDISDCVYQLILLTKTSTLTKNPNQPINQPINQSFLPLAGTGWPQPDAVHRPGLL
jgi:hypothetical protein